MQIIGIELSPEAAGTLAALVENERVNALTKRKFRLGPAGDPWYAELVNTGFAAEFSLTEYTSRYELLREVEMPKIEFSSAKQTPDYTVTLTDEQREMLARKHQNDREISHAINGGKYEQRRFDSRCLSNYRGIPIA